MDIVQKAAGFAWRRLATLRRRARERRDLATFRRVDRMVRTRERAQDPSDRPVVLMNVSSRIGTMAYNAATEILVGWALRAAGHRVVHYSCDAGLAACQMGTEPADPLRPPPCATCVAFSRAHLPRGRVRAFGPLPAADEGFAALVRDLERRPFPELVAYEAEGLPLGRLVVPSLMWSLRVGHPERDPAGAALAARFIASAARLARDFKRLLDEERPKAVVLFNGTSYPEAVAAALARQRGVRVVTYESGFMEGSIFFSHGESTKYDVDVPEGFELTEHESARLDEYLRRRFKGDFTMGGVRFWPKMAGLDPALQERMERHRQVVAVFTNVIFDTSQAHANVVFDDMFEWLDETLEAARANPDTLFVVRAHPDEARGWKSSREPVSAWMKQKGWLDVPNVAFVPPQQLMDSYGLVQRSKVTLVYNSTIGLESVLLGTPTLCGGLAKYNASGAVVFPRSRDAYREELQRILDAERVEVDAATKQRARRFFYYMLYRSCLDLSKYLGKGADANAVHVGSLDDLDPRSATEIRIILDGILEGKPFVYPIDPAAAGATTPPPVPAAR